MKVPPFHNPVHLAEPKPGSALRCNAGWQSLLPPASPSVQTQTAGAALEGKHQIQTDDQHLFLSDGSSREIE